MQRETVEELIEYLADWFGFYSGCKKPFCCRAGSMHPSNCFFIAVITSRDYLVRNLK